jgi:regulatory protein YycI of two-component signal transduction system YycFG
MTDKYIITVIIVVLLLLLLRCVYVDRNKAFAESTIFRSRYERLMQEHLKLHDDLDEMSKLISTLRAENMAMYNEQILKIERNKECWK